jgi:hypothetical protein
MDGDREVRRLGPLRAEAARFLELVGVLGLAIAQPTFDVLGKSPGLFVAWQATPRRALVLVTLVILLPALAAYAVEVVVGSIVPRARSGVHAALLGIGVGLIVAEVLKHGISLGPAPVLAVSVAAAIGAAMLFARVALLRLWTRLLALAPVLFAVLLLLESPAAAVIFDSHPAPAEVSVAVPTRVVMIVLDELPTASLLDGSGRVDAALFPNFAALARDGTWYRNSTTVAPVTEAAVPAILTGELPHPGDPAAVTNEYPKNLFTLLGGSYRMNVHESLTRLCPTNLCVPRARSLGAGKGTRGMVADAASIWAEFADPRESDSPVFDLRFGLDSTAFATGERFVSTLRPSGSRPRLDFLHVLLPHFPWHYLATGQDYASLPGHANGLHGQAWASDEVASLMRVRHLLQVQATDTLLGRVVTRLRELGEYENSMVVVTADHGVAFEGGAPMRSITPATVPDIAWTPLFIKAPGRAGGAVDDRAAESIDVLPTIADHLGVELPWPVDGRSLLGPERQAETFPMSPTFHSLPGSMPVGRDGFVHLDRAAGFTAVLERRAAAPDGTPEDRVFRVGPFASLIGEEVSSLPVAEPSTATVSLDAAWRYEGVNRAAAFAPYAQIHGWTSLPDAGRHLAVAVNGTIAGLSVAYRSPGSDRVEFWATLVPGSFRDGDNDVRIYRIDGPVGSPTLRLLGDSAAASSDSAAPDG